MRRVFLFLSVCVAAAVPNLAVARRPVVVELFTAQGCSSCVKANGLLGQIADRPGVVVLTWSVDYWDYLGWKDTFAKPEFTERQRRYERRLSLRDVYTPQVVVDGASQSPGDKPAEIDALIQQARHAVKPGPEVRFLSHGRLAVGVGRRPQGGADVWLVRYDPKPQDIEVTAGDNSGAKVPYRGVVRQISRLGAWTGKSSTFKIPSLSGPGLNTLVLVQAARGGPIIAATPEPDAEP